MLLSQKVASLLFIEFLRKLQTRVGHSVTEPRPSCSLLAARKPVPETSVGRKGKVALFRRPAARGEGGLLSENQRPTAAQGAGAFKGEFQGCTGGGRAQGSVGSSDRRLEIRNVMV